MTAPRELRLDCRYFRGEKPCIHGNVCEGCEHHSPGQPRILIIKLDALGDVLRTTSVLRGLHKVYEDAHITWLVDPSGLGLLEHNPMIDVLLGYELGSIMPLQVERFDLVLSLDKTHRATSVGMLVQADEKRGFGLNEYGNIFPLNPGARYAFELGLCDDLKFRRNERTYQDVIFEAAGLAYEREDYVFELSDEAKEFQQAFAVSHQLQGRPVVGINCGGGAAFANKMWSADQIVEFVRAVTSKTDVEVLIYGAHREQSKMRQIAEATQAIHTGIDNSLEQFAALMGLAHVVVTGDSLGMHFAIALQRQVVALFGPTCHQEIELYGRGACIVSPRDCTPCYKRVCQQSPTCMEQISPQAVANDVLTLI